jgi:hypothetical protein
MKVIRKGTIPEQRVCHGTCNKCGTVVEFQHGEATISSDQRDMGAFYVNCPTCKSYIWGKYGAATSDTWGE